MAPSASPLESKLRARTSKDSPPWVAAIANGVGVPLATPVAAAEAAGGTVLIAPDEAEEAGTIATLEDPQGGVFSVLEV